MAKPKDCRTAKAKATEKAKAKAKAVKQMKPHRCRAESTRAIRLSCFAPTAAAAAKRRRTDGVSNMQRSVVKIFVSHCKPNYDQPWCCDSSTSSTSTGFPIRLRTGELRLVTNAHSVEHHSLVQVKRHFCEEKWVAKVLCIGTDCDLALLEVPDAEFWKGLPPFVVAPGLPFLQDAVSVLGYPTGGENLSVTQGVVSRIDLVEYAQSGAELLGVQIDAAINSGNSGGPAVDKNGHLVGVAFQALGADDDAENIGYIIPCVILMHFLQDYVGNGHFTGFGSAGFDYQALESPSLRMAMGLKKGESGVRVSHVHLTGPSTDMLLPDDVLLKVGKNKVGNDGSIAFERGRISFAYYLQCHFPGESCTLEVRRAGHAKPLSLRICLQRNRRLVDVDPSGASAAIGTAPRYLVVGGLVFVPLSVPFLESAFGEDYHAEAPTELKVLLESGIREAPGHEVVVLTQVIASQATIGYTDLEYERLEAYNGLKVQNLEHLAAMVDACEEQFEKFAFASKHVIVLERLAASQALPEILAQNMIPAARSKGL